MFIQNSHCKATCSNPDGFSGHSACWHSTYAWSQSERTHTHQYSHSPMLAHSSIYLFQMWLPRSQSIANLSCTQVAQLWELSSVRLPFEHLCSPGPLLASSSSALRCQHSAFRQKEFVNSLQKWCYDHSGVVLRTENGVLMIIAHQVRPSTPAADAPISPSTQPTCIPLQSSQRDPCIIISYFRFKLSECNPSTNLNHRVTQHDETKKHFEKLELTVFAARKSSDPIGETEAARIRAPSRTC